MDACDLSLAEALRGRVAGHFLPAPPARLGVAVSGGSDSLGLLAVLTDWARAGGPALAVVTVDHGLRPEAAEEARAVAGICARAGLSHDVLRWDGPAATGNLPDQARRARYALMAQWAAARKIGQVALGHTLDDLAETFLMRLAREAGIDGLAAMAARKHVDGTEFCRPALGVTRAEFRSLLRAQGTTWVEDPTNEDPTYARVQARKALELLGPLGISADGLAAVAHHLADVRATLGSYARQAAETAVTFDTCDILFAAGRFTLLPDETARRLLQAALRVISGAEYGPRGRALSEALEAIGAGGDVTLHGCLIRQAGGQIRITREHKAVADLRVRPGQIWDNRWTLTGPETPGATVAALGLQGVTQCGGARDTGLPRSTLAATPAVWREGALLAAPLAGEANGWAVTQSFGLKERFAALLSH